MIHVQFYVRQVDEPVELLIAGVELPQASHGPNGLLGVPLGARDDLRGSDRARGWGARWWTRSSGAWRGSAWSR